MPFPIALGKGKHIQLRVGFELGSSGPFPWMITVTPRAANVYQYYNRKRIVVPRKLNMFLEINVDNHVYLSIYPSIYLISIK